MWDQMRDQQLDQQLEQQLVQLWWVMHLEILESLLD